MKNYYKFVRIIRSYTKVYTIPMMSFTGKSQNAENLYLCSTLKPSKIVSRIKISWDSI